jgi:hypothetical protein
MFTISNVNMIQMITAENKCLKLLSLGKNSKLSRGS